MKLVKIKTLGKDGNTYYPIYLIIEMQINGVVSNSAIRVYTHKDDKVGFNKLSMSSEYYPNCSSISSYLTYLATNDEKYLNGSIDDKKKDK